MKNKKLMLLLIIIFTVIAIILGIVINLINSNNQNNNTVNTEPQEKTIEEIANEELEQLKNMRERERMEFYVSKYISYLEAEDYETAYSLLYDEFKQNYFKTIDEFKSYIKQKYSDIIILSYTDIQRLGTYYILTVEFTDIVNNEKNFTQLFVIKENNFNDFVLSFQAQ